MSCFISLNPPVGGSAKPWCLLIHAKVFLSLSLSLSRGPGRKPGASLYTRKHLSPLLSLNPPNVSCRVLASRRNVDECKPPVETHVDSARCHCLKQKHCELLQVVAFNSNLRCYTLEELEAEAAAHAVEAAAEQVAGTLCAVRRSRFSVSKTLLNAPMVSALETKL